MKLTVNAPLVEPVRANVYVMFDVSLFAAADGDTDTPTAATPEGSTVRANGIAFVPSLLVACTLNVYTPATDAVPLRRPV